MSIDIESLTYEELLELKHIIVERLKYLDSINPQKNEMLFRPGDEVSFAHPTQGRQTGVLLRYNHKTVTVVTKTGQRWDVSPHLLRKIVKPTSKSKNASNIISLKKDENPKK